MPKIADYIIILNGSVTLPNPSNADIDHEFRNITVPNVDAASPSIVAFRVDPRRIPVTLQVRLNGRQIFPGEQQIFNTEPQRSWHQVVPPNVLKPAENELIVSVKAEPGKSPGSVAVSDIVLFFQANIP